MWSPSQWTGSAKQCNTLFRAQGEQAEINVALLLTLQGVHRETERPASSQATNKASACLSGSGARWRTVFSVLNTSTRRCAWQAEGDTNLGLVCRALKVKCNCEVPQLKQQGREHL